MDPLSVAAASVSFADATARVARGCFELYQFWKSVQDAPAELQRIKNRLQLFRDLLLSIMNEPDLVTPLPPILAACVRHVQILWDLVTDGDVEPTADMSKSTRIRAKVKMRTTVKQAEKFHKEWSELGNMLSDALAYQNMSDFRRYVTNQTVETVTIHAGAAGGPRHRLKEPFLRDTLREMEPAAALSTDTPDMAGRKVPWNEDPLMGAIASSPVTKEFIQRALHSAVDNMVASGTMQQLLESSLSQVTSFQTSHCCSYTADTHDVPKVPSSVNEASDVRNKESDGRTTDADEGGAEKPPRLARLKICHRKSSMGLMFGSLWVRTCTLKATDDSTTSHGNLELSTSYSFYPAPWVRKIGLRYGTEFNSRRSPKAGLTRSISAIRAVPEDALLFALCRAGNVGAVQMLLSRGDASLRDTSPDGWTALHFAAQAGQVEMCAALIKAGADRQALAYKGPTKDALTPLGMWSEYCRATPSKQKIAMMRTFGSECLDLSEFNGDGWVVGHNLIKSMALEECDMAETAVQWLYTQKRAETFIALSTNSIWHGLQQAVRGFLVEEHGRSVLRGLLQTNSQKVDARYQSQVSAIGHWLALRASQRELVPLVIQAAQCLRVDGFDPIPDMKNMTERDLNRLLPHIYTTWANRSPCILADVPNLVADELELLLDEMSMNKESLARCIQASTDAPTSYADVMAHTCVDCHDDYTALGKGLVQPRRISFGECPAIRHKSQCDCLDYLQEKGTKPARPAPKSGVTASGDDVEAKEHCKVEAGINLLDPEHGASRADGNTQRDPFYNAATVLYRAQGRRWIGTYKASESLCAACFLKREKYTGEGGPADGECFTPVPSTYVSACPSKVLDATYTC